MYYTVIKKINLKTKNRTLTFPTPEQTIIRLQLTDRKRYKHENQVQMLSFQSFILYC